MSCAKGRIIISSLTPYVLGRFDREVRDEERKAAALANGTVFAIYLADEDEAAPPAKIELYSRAPRAGSVVRMLGVREPVRWERAGKGVLLTLPAAALASPPCRHAWAFEITPTER